MDDGSKRLVALGVHPFISFSCFAAGAAQPAFADFIVGRPMTGMTKCDPPRGQGVWRLKTPDLRLYGWAPVHQTMVIAAGELKRTLILPGPPKDRDLGKLVVSERKRLGFSDWKFGDVAHVFPAPD